MELGVEKELRGGVEEDGPGIKDEAEGSINARPRGAVVVEVEGEGGELKDFIYLSTWRLEARRTSTVVRI